MNAAVPARPFVKMHGTENVFVLVDERPPRFEHYDLLARMLCDPAGPMEGADGVLVVRDAPGAAAEMRVFNADGGEAEMCGNGVRCVARYLGERGAGDAFTIGTLAGPVAVRIVARQPFEATVDIGCAHFPQDAEEERFDALGATWRYYDVSLGNPHAVIFVDDVCAIDLPALGEAAQRLARFPKGTNVHLATRVNAATLRVRHFERGVGLTQACGTGAVACAAAAILARDCSSPMTVQVPGGTLAVAWHPGESAQLTGGAQTLFARTLSFMMRGVAAGHPGLAYADAQSNVYFDARAVPLADGGDVRLPRPDELIPAPPGTVPVTLPGRSPPPRGQWPGASDRARGAPAGRVYATITARV